MPVKNSNSTFNFYHKKNKSDKEILMSPTINGTSTINGISTKSYLAEKFYNGLKGLTNQHLKRNDRLTILQTKLPSKYQADMNRSFNTFQKKMASRGGSQTGK
jgi:hypothetical protein